MPCLVVVLALLSPRLALIAMAVLSDVLSRSMDSWILPLVGFFVLPWTTLAWALTWNYGTNAVTGFEWFIVGFFFLVDLGAVGGTARGRD